MRHSRRVKTESGSKEQRGFRRVVHKESLSQGPRCPHMNDQKPATEVPDCEECGRPMMVKFVTLRLSEPGRMIIYQCADCEKVTFVPAPPVR